MPPTLIFCPFALMAARTLRTNLAVTMTLGALIGLIPGFFITVPDLVTFGGRRVEFTALFLLGAAGAAFGAVIWYLCIRPRRARALA